MTQVVIVGCGVVGATIAYELSQIPGLSVTVIDRQPPAQAATGAALGVLMGAISHKVKGKAWRMRQASLKRYETLIPELAAAGHPIPFNRQGIVMLCFEGDDLSRWQTLVETRRTQGWQLEVWDAAQLGDRCPQIVSPPVRAAVYSPQDRQVNPTALTLALVAAAQERGVAFRFDRSAQACEVTAVEHLQHCHQIHTDQETFAADWVVIAAGLGSTPLTQTLERSIEIRPVLGQALRVKLAYPLGNFDFQPVITGSDIHLVPLQNQEYWVGATVELPSEAGIAAEPDADRLQSVLQGAIDFCPALADAEVIETWSGLRPRPHNRPAPIVEPLPGYDNVLLAIGHYRNGVLLAPATAEIIRDAIAQTLS